MALEFCVKFADSCAGSKLRWRGVQAAAVRTLQAAGGEAGVLVFVRAALPHIFRLEEAAGVSAECERADGARGAARAAAGRLRARPPDLVPDGRRPAEEAAAARGRDPALPEQVRPRGAAVRERRRGPKRTRRGRAAGGEDQDRPAAEAGNKGLHGRLPAADRGAPRPDRTEQLLHQAARRRPAEN